MLFAKREAQTHKDRVLTPVYFNYKQTVEINSRFGRHFKLTVDLNLNIKMHLAEH